MSATTLGAERPFSGLRPYGYDDRAYFFGRDDQRDDLYRLLSFGFVAVIGSSGSGKSSLVRAGLLPLLVDVPADERWAVATLAPGDSPMKNLGDAVAALDPHPADPAARRARIEYLLQRSSAGLTEAVAETPGLAGRDVLIVVDQFEEIFRYGTVSARRDETVRFVQSLLQFARRGTSQHVLITMRSDFIGDCAQFQDLPEAVSDVQFLVPALTREQRKEIIEGPIRKAGATIDGDLVQRLLNDVGYEQDQLPVLQHCLLRMWHRAAARPERPVSIWMDDYQKVGLLHGALSQEAEEIMSKDLAGLEEVVALIFRALSERDREGRATRRAVSFGNLVKETGAPEADVRKVVDRFRRSDCAFLLPIRTDDAGP